MCHYHALQMTYRQCGAIAKTTRRQCSQGTVLHTGIRACAGLLQAMNSHFVPSCCSSDLCYIVNDVAENPWGIACSSKEAFALEDSHSILQCSMRSSLSVNASHCVWTLQDIWELNAFGSSHEAFAAEELCEAWVSINSACLSKHTVIVHGMLQDILGSDVCSSSSEGFANHSSSGIRQYHY